VNIRKLACTIALFSPLAILWGAFYLWHELHASGKWWAIPFVLTTIIVLWLATCLSIGIALARIKAHNSRKS